MAAATSNVYVAAAAAGAQYRPSDPWLLNVGIAYDSGFQPSGSNISLPRPLKSVRERSDAKR